MNEFADITPEDFSGRMAGLPVPTFEAFVETCHFALRNAVVLQGELPIPMIVVANERQVAPLPSPGGTLETTLPWIGEQMREREASWFFFAMQANVNWYYDDGAEMADFNDKEQGNPEGATPGVFYYASARTGSWFVRRSGLAHFVSAGADLGPFRDAPVDQPVALFDAVMA